MHIEKPARDNLVASYGFPELVDFDGILNDLGEFDRVDVWLPWSVFGSNGVGNQF